MKMDGEIRIRTDVKHRCIYKDLKDLQVIGQYHELFFLCVCIAYKYGKKKPLGGRGEDRFRSADLSSDEWAVYYAMMVEMNDMKWSLPDEKEMFRQIEEYANAGMDMLIELFLGDYLTSEHGEQRVLTSEGEELPRHFLAFLFEDAISENNSL